MKRLSAMMLILCCALPLLLPARGGAEAAERRDIVFYEIFPGSFSDSDGDGTGDLRGILNRLDYLNDGDPASGASLGIEGIWLTPVFASPSYHKYDVADYYAVDPRFGSMADLEALIAGCHARGISLILDLPLNHTSRTHPWFDAFVRARQSGDAENEYYDWYICHEGGSIPAGHTCYPIPGTDLWYEGNFSPDMPELNYDNEAVRQAALDIARYYLNLGADGFRFDAAKYIHFGDNARSAAFWEAFCGELRALRPDIRMVAEVWDSDPVTLQYAGAADCFNFTLAGAEGLIAGTAGAGNVNRYAAYMVEYLAAVRARRAEGTVVPFLSNHDMDRAAGFLPESNGRIRMAANLYLLGPGTPFIYYGEEIGMRGSRGGANTDANRRLAMRWGDGDTVTDPEGADYGKQTEATVASMEAEENSLLHYYRKVIALRKAHPEISRGECRALRLPDTKAGGFLFSWEGRDLAVVHNTTTRAAAVDLAGDPQLAGAWRISGWVGRGEASLEGTVLTLGKQTTALLTREE